MRTTTIIIIAAKEFWYDIYFESPEVRGSSLEDFIFYCIGILGGGVVILFSGAV